MVRKYLTLFHRTNTTNLMNVITSCPLILLLFTHIHIQSNFIALLSTVTAYNSLRQLESGSPRLEKLKSPFFHSGSLKSFSFAPVAVYT